MHKQKKVYKYKKRPVNSFGINSICMPDTNVYTGKSNTYSFAPGTPIPLHEWETWETLTRARTNENFREEAHAMHLHYEEQLRQQMRQQQLSARTYITNQQYRAPNPLISGEVGVYNGFTFTT